MKVFEREQLERLRALIAERLGLDYSDDKLADLASVAARRIEREGHPSVDGYLEVLASARESAAELFALAEDLTVNETFFFRSADHLRVLREVVLPALRQSGRRRLRVASVGCASGEEPYSIAMELCEALPDLSQWEVSIVAFDVSAAMLDKARRALFSQWSLRATPDELKARHFTASGRDFLLERRIREMVRFEQLNLADGGAAVWRSLACDAIFCRNVLMYLTPALVQRVVSRFERALPPGGFLFLGHAETLRGLSHEFHLCHTHESFYYQRRNQDDQPGELVVDQPSRVSAAFTGDHGSDGSWVGSIEQASARVLALALPTPARKVPPFTSHARAKPPEAGPTVDLALVLELLRKERFGDALSALRSLPAEAKQDADALLVLGVLLTNNGASDEAEATCRELLAQDELNAGAHYLMALCREHAADLRGASEHDRTAIYLDPGFSMPHLHLGLLARRAGDTAVARRELGQALILLKREDAARLLLFGGGFAREGLLRLCRAELAAAGGQA